jgi:hypothetical protein
VCDFTVYPREEWQEDLNAISFVRIREGFTEGQWKRDMDKDLAKIVRFAIARATNIFGEHNRFSRTQHSVWNEVLQAFLAAKGVHWFRKRIAERFVLLV